MSAALLTTYAAGQRLGVSSAEALRLAKAGAFGAVRRNGSGRVLIPAESVEAYKAAHPQTIEARGGGVPGVPAPQTPPRRAALGGQSEPAIKPTLFPSPCPPGAFSPAEPEPPPERDDDGVPLPPGRMVVLSLVPLRAADPPGVRLRRLAETARSLDLRITAVRVEPAEAA